MTVRQHHAGLASGAAMVLMLTMLVLSGCRGDSGDNAQAAPSTRVAQPQSTSGVYPGPYSWQTVPYGGGGFIDGFLYHPTTPNLLYARTDIGGMYRYDFAHKRWLPLLDHLPHADADLMGVLSMAIDPTDSNKIYAATGLYLPTWARTGAILRSSDRGHTWLKTELPIRVGGNSDGRGTGDRLMVDPVTPSTLWYGSNQDGLWKSTDSGASFARVTAFPTASISLVIFAPGSHDLYVGSASGNGALYVSHDNGVSFAVVSGPPAQVPQHAVFAAGGAMYVTFAQGDNGAVVNPSNAVRGGVWKRSSGGTWSDVSPVSGSTFGYSGVDAGPDGRIVVSTLDRWWPGDELFSSTDGGAHWQGLEAQSQHNASAYPWLVDYLGGQDKVGHWLADLRINPFNADEMIYGTGYGLWMSRNLTAAGTGPKIQFDANLDNLEEGAVTQMTSPTGGAKLMASMGDMSGAAWDDVSKTPGAKLFRRNTESNLSIDYAGLQPAFLVRTVASTGTHGFYSEDGGRNWTLFASSAYHAPATGPGTITVSANATSLLWAPAQDAAYYSTDKGATWHLSANWPATRDQALTPVSDKTSDGRFYVYDRGTGRVLASTDGGATFTVISSSVPSVQSWETAQFAAVPTRTRDLWLALPSGLRHSRDASAAFAVVPNVDAAWAITFGAPAAPGGYPAVYLYGKVTGKEGLWRSADEGATWSRINDDAHQFGNMQSMAGDLFEYGTLYIAPNGRGIVAGRMLR